MANWKVPTLCLTSSATKRSQPLAWPTANQWSLIQPMSSLANPRRSPPSTANHRVLFHQLIPPRWPHILRRTHGQMRHYGKMRPQRIPCSITLSNWKMPSKIHQQQKSFPLSWHPSMSCQLTCQQCCQKPVISPPMQIWQTARKCLVSKQLCCLSIIASIYRSIYKLHYMMELWYSNIPQSVNQSWKNSKCAWYVPDICDSSLVMITLYQETADIYPVYIKWTETNSLNCDLNRISPQKVINHHQISLALLHECLSYKHSHLWDWFSYQTDLFEVRNCPRINNMFNMTNNGELCQ